MDKKLRLAFTLGDPAGIGIEIFQKFFATAKDYHDIEITLIDSESELASVNNKITPGKASAFAGEYAYQTLERANRLLCNGAYDYLITGPVAKESLWMAGVQCSGQTELLAQLNNLTRDQIEMIFVLENFRVLLATRHIPIRDVAEVLEQRLESVINNGVDAMQTIFGISNPRLALAGLNPHAGENGIIGLEENNFMKPLVQKLQTIVNIQGPFPADGLFAQAAQQFLHGQTLNHDLFIATYHDQILPLIKGIGGLEAINLTYGLPYLRLSVDHGTGFDIVGRNIASPAGLLACTKFCQNQSLLAVNRP